MTTRFADFGRAAAIAAALAAAVSAADHGGAGRKLALADGTRDRLAWTSKDAALVPPAPDGADDPTAVGSSLLVTNPKSGELASVDLPASGWTRTRAGATASAARRAPRCGRPR